MEPIFDNTIQLLSKAIEGAQLKHEIISNNIANVDTPGYKALDVNFQKELKQALERIGKIDTNQISRIKWSEDKLSFDQSVEPRVDGNTVDLGRQLVEMNKNVALYNTFIKALSAKVKILQTAVSGKA